MGDLKRVSLDVLLVPLPVFSAPAKEERAGAHFLHQAKAECLFLNGTQRVRYLHDLGKFVAVTALGEASADYWNRDERWMQDQKAAVDRFCRNNYEIGSYEPTVTISPTKMDPASPNTILLCTATGFYPLEIEVQWLKNGQLEEEGVAFGEELQNGDWTYQLQVMLETQPQRGDVYTCQVGHVSLEAPITVQWGKPLPSLPSCPEKGERPSLWGSRNGPSWGKVGLILLLRIFPSFGELQNGSEGAPQV
uniref:Ig-like domain-containing protein n=1 Tax=Naja naja TaxID=35670 RepID=A0A8C6VBN8_NAJNA